MSNQVSSCLRIYSPICLWMHHDNLTKPFIYLPAYPPVHPSTDLTTSFYFPNPPILSTPSDLPPYLPPLLGTFLPIYHPIYLLFYVPWLPIVCSLVTCIISFILPCDRPISLHTYQLTLHTSSPLSPLSCPSLYLTDSHSCSFYPVWLLHTYLPTLLYLLYNPYHLPVYLLG